MFFPRISKCLHVDFRKIHRWRVILKISFFHDFRCNDTSTKSKKAQNNANGPQYDATGLFHSEVRKLFLPLTCFVVGIVKKQTI